MFFKVLNKDQTATSPYANGFRYEVNKWTPDVDYVQACKSGYHLAELKDFLRWGEEGCDLWRAQGRGWVDFGEGKSAYQSARIVKKIGHFTREAMLDIARSLVGSWISLLMSSDKFPRENQLLCAALRQIDLARRVPCPEFSREIPDRTMVALRDLQVECSRDTNRYRNKTVWLLEDFSGMVRHEVNSSNLNYIFDQVAEEFNGRGEFYKLEAICKKALKRLFKEMKNEVV